MALRERMMEASSTGKVTMVDWNKAFDKMLRSRDVYQTIKSNLLEIRLNTTQLT